MNLTEILKAEMIKKRDSQLLEASPQPQHRELKGRFAYFKSWSYDPI